MLSVLAMTEAATKNVERFQTPVKVQPCTERILNLQPASSHYDIQGAPLTALTLDHMYGCLGY